MSRMLNLGSSSGKMEEENWAVFAEKVEIKRKMLEKATEAFDRLSYNVEKSQMKLAKIKTERFSIEEQIQESEVRVRVYEAREKELKEYGKGLTESVEGANRNLLEVLASRDAQGKDFVRQVIQMADGYCKFKKDCDRRIVMECSQHLNTVNSELTSEILIEAEEFTGHIDEGNSAEGFKMPPLKIVDVGDQEVISSLRDLQAQVQNEIMLVDVSKIKLEARVSELEVKKCILQKEVNALREVWNK